MPAHVIPSGFVRTRPTGEAARTADAPLVSPWTVEVGAGGWYTLTAPGAEPVKAQGVDKARATLGDNAAQDPDGNPFSF